MNRRTIIAIAAAAGLLSAHGANAQSADSSSDSDSARLKKLENAVTQLQQENDALKQQIGSSAPTTDATSSLTSKIILSAPVKEMDIYGELRLRYFMNEAEVSNSTATGERNRMRYRMRIGDNIKLSDNFMIGILVEANNSAHSANVTLGNSTSNAADSEVYNKGTVTTTTTSTAGHVVTGVTASGTITTGQAVTGTAFGSTVSAVNFQDALFFGQVYMKYSPFDWVTLEGGKLPNPFISTPMTWDPDIYPEGLAEKFKFTFGPWGGGHSTTAGYSKDDGKSSKDVASAEEPGGMTLDLFGNFGQFIYNDTWTNNFNVSSTGQINSPQQNDVWQLGFQVGAKANFNKNTFLQVAPTFYTYSGGGNAFGGNFSGDGPQVIVPTAGGAPVLVFPNETAVNNLNIVDIPAEFDWKWWNIPFRIFGDFADNLSSQDRASAAGHPDKGGEGIAWQAGAAIGKIQKKGDWEISGWFQRSGQYSVDPNIVDDNIFDGRLNMQGFYVQASYAFTDAFSIIVQGSRATQIDTSIGTAGEGALGDPAGLPLREASLLYVNLSLKF